MKLTDLPHITLLAEQRARTRVLLDKVSIYPERLHLHMNYFDPDDNISGIVGGKWMGEAVKEQCQKLIAFYDARMTELGVEVNIAKEIE